MKGAKYSEAIDRLLTATKSKTESDLAVALGIKAQSVHQAKKKDLVPTTWFVKISLKYGVPMDWLVSGGELKDAIRDPQNAPLLCSNCVELYKKIDGVRERLEIAHEREIVLLKENNGLKAKNAELESRLSLFANSANANTA